MLLKKIKRLHIVQLIGLLLIIAFAIFIGACVDKDPEGGEDNIEEEVEEIKNYLEGPDALSWGTSFTPLTLGLTPGNDTTEIRLTWYSQGTPAAKTAQVRFIRGTQAAGTELIEKTGTVTDTTSGYTTHKAEITGLKSGASYVYSVSTNGTDWSPVYEFKVPPAEGNFSFAVIADAQLLHDGTNGSGSIPSGVDKDSRYPNPSNGTTHAGWMETMQIIKGKNVSFVVSCGDQVDLSYTTDATSFERSELEYSRLFAPAGLRNLPFAPTSGNHDRHIGYHHHYNWPNTQTFNTETDDDAAGGSGRNYFYLYNNILFVHLNTAAYPSSTSQAAPYISRFSETLTAAKAKFSSYDWLIVVHHKSTASVGDHCADRDIQYYVEAGFETIMSQHNVDFVLAGHDHVYARSYPLQGQDGGKVSVPVKNTGTNVTTANASYTNPTEPIYLTFTTGSGIKYYAVSSDPYYPYVYAVDGSPRASLYVRDNVQYPYLGIGANNMPDEMGSVGYIGNDYKTAKLPVSNAKYVQPYIPSYTIVEVTNGGKTISFKTYPIYTTSVPPAAGNEDDGLPNFEYNTNTPYDTVTVTKN